jgi:hypothetical protein
LRVWNRYHLNTHHSECEHQRALGWTYKTHEGQKCPTCGYEIGTEWKTEAVPEQILISLAGLPDTDRRPAWV